MCCNKTYTHIIQELENHSVKFACCSEDDSLLMQEFDNGNCDSSNSAKVHAIRIHPKWNNTCFDSFDESLFNNFSKVYRRLNGINDASYDIKDQNLLVLQWNCAISQNCSNDVSFVPGKTKINTFFFFFFNFGCTFFSLHTQHMDTSNKTKQTNKTNKTRKLKIDIYMPKTCEKCNSGYDYVFPRTKTNIQGTVNVSSINQPFACNTQNYKIFAFFSMVLFYEHAFLFGLTFL